MPVPAQPPIDNLEAALTTLEGELSAIKAENAQLKQQMASGVLTDAQGAKMQAFTDAVNTLGKLSGSSGTPA